MLHCVSLKASTICFMQGICGIDDVVGQHDSERLVADDLLGLQHRVAEAERLGLARVADLGEIGDAAHDLEQRRLVLGFERGLELGTAVEVIFHGATCRGR